MTIRKISSSTKVKCRRIGTPINRMDPTEPGLAARCVLRSSAKYPSGPNLAQLYWRGRFRHDVIYRLVIRKDTPLFDQAFFHYGAPRGGYLPFVCGQQLPVDANGAARCTKHRNDVPV